MPVAEAFKLEPLAARDSESQRELRSFSAGSQSERSESSAANSSRCKAPATGVCTSFGSKQIRVQRTPIRR